jgi:hypothetical protein
LTLELHLLQLIERNDLTPSTTSTSPISFRRRSSLLAGLKVFDVEGTNAAVLHFRLQAGDGSHQSAERREVTSKEKTAD